VTDTTLESIFSGRGEAAPSPEPETVTETPVSEPQPAPQQEPSPEPDPEPAPSDTGMVPVAALQQERAKAKRYTEAVQSFEQRLAEQNTQWQAKFDQLFATLQQRQPTQPQPAQPQPLAQAPDWFEDPDARLQHAVAPIVQQQSQIAETISRRFAVMQHGQEKVDAAYKAMAEGLRTDPQTQFEYQRIMQSDDPWNGLVQWHQKQSVFAEIGTDPAAYREKVRAELLAEIQQTGRVPTAPQAAPAAAVMPSDLADARTAGARSGPAYSGPPPLTDIFKR
jgi:hypothetical protein